MEAEVRNEERMTNRLCEPVAILCSLNICD